MNNFDENKKSRGKVLKIVIPVAAILITVAIIIGINLTSKNKKGGWGAWGGFGGQATVTSVKTVVAEKTVLKDFLNTSGDVQTQTSIEVFPSIGGKVVKMNVSLGSSVKKGDVIAYIDPSEPGSYYANSPVTAPISGSVLQTPLKTGQKVSVSSVITKIGDIDNLQITAKVPEKYVSELKIGLKAEITLEAYPDVVFTATVSRISPVVDSATRTKEIILNFDKKDSRINAGMLAKIKLYTTEYPDSIIIQQDALVNNNDNYYLYVVNEDGETVTKRQVTLGKNVDGYYQILSGIEEGETVVVKGTLTLAEGSKIKDIDKIQAETPADKPAEAKGDFPGDFPSDFQPPADGKGKGDKPNSDNKKGKKN